MLGWWRQKGVRLEETIQRWQATDICDKTRKSKIWHLVGFPQTWQISASKVPLIGRSDCEHEHGQKYWELVGWTAQVQPSTLPTDQPTISLPLHQLLLRIKQRERRIHLRTLISSQGLLLHGVWETIMVLQGRGLVVFEKTFQNLSSWADLHLLIGQCQGSVLTPRLTPRLTPWLTPRLTV